MIKDNRSTESAFDPYIASFKAYAKQYGHNFDNTPVVMHFANLTDGKAGQCYMHSNPVYIEIDRAYWNQLEGSSNKENLRQELIFHEMGHGLLDRYHLNDQLNRSDWKSMMFGDALPNNCQPTLNFRGMRKEYYIEELFTQTNQAPAWSTLPEPDFSQVTEYELAKLSPDFCPYPLLKNENIDAYLANNQVVITNKKDYEIAIPLTVTYPTQQDFYFEVTYQTTANKNITPESGLIWGDNTTTNLHYFSIDQDKHAKVGEITCMYPFLDFYNGSINNQQNTVAVRKQGNFVYYYINGEFVYYNDTQDLRTGGNLVGISISGNTTLRITGTVIKGSQSVQNKQATARNPFALPKPLPAKAK